MVLMALGLVVLSSAGEANGVRLHNDPYHFIKYQGVFALIGVALATVVACVDYRNWRDEPWLAWLFFVCVLATLVWAYFSPAVNGSHRWIRIARLRLQPSEFAKLVTVILVSVWMDRAAGHKVEEFWRGAVLPLLIIGALAGLIIIEPDFGSVFVVGAVGLLIMFVAGTRLWYIFSAMALGGAIVAYKVLTNANRMARLFDDKKLYQVKMALAAIGNGGVWGVGLGESMQKQFYLPEAHTDFIFAVGAEELGLWFSVSVIVLFAVFFVLSVHIARNACDRFGRFLVIGMAFLVFFQAMFNLGVVCKAMPTKGVALPFFSYGGTNLLSAFFAVGTILSVGIHSYREQHRVLLRKVLMRR